jgi:alpha-ketoglutarate-dependent taurine dioxygenase
MIQTNGLSPLLYGHPDAPVVRVDRDFVRVPEGDVEGRHAFTELVRHLDNNIYEVVLEAGDVCFIDNRNVVHGRRPFHARRDGQDRWLKRVNIVTDLRRTRPGRRSADTRIVG